MRRTVLYVDDTPVLPARTREVLAAIDLDLAHAGDAREALRLARETPPALVLLEVLLENGDGFALLEELRGVHPDREVPVVVVTRGERSPQLYGRALECGAREFLCKPLLPAQVLEAALEYGSEEAGGPPGSVTLAGELAEESLPALLGRLHQAGASGVLTLTRDDAERRVQLRNGSPVAATGPRRKESFEDYALRSGWIKAEQIDEAVDQVVLGNGDICEALVGMGALTPVQAEQIVQEQGRDVFLDLFAWDSGAFVFEPGERLAEAGSWELVCDPQESVIAGVLWQVSETALRRELSARAAAYPLPGRDFDAWAERMGLADDGGGGVAVLDGSRSVGELLADEAVDLRRLYASVVLGAVALETEPVLQLVEPWEDGPAPEPEEAPVPEPAAGSAAEAEPAFDVEAWLRELSGRVSQADDFALFGIGADSGDAEVQQAYRALLASFPTLPPELDDLARQVRGRIDRAYARVRSADAREAFASLNAARAKPAEPAPAPEAEVDRSIGAEEWFRRGRERLQADDHAGAIEALGMAMHLDPDQGDYVAHLGYALFLSDPRNEVIKREAMEHIAKGVKLAPDRATPLLFLGRVFRRSGDAAMAAKVLRRALEIAPDHHGVLHELCLVQVDERSGVAKGWRARFGRLARRRP